MIDKVESCVAHGRQSERAPDSEWRYVSVPTLNMPNANMPTVNMPNANVPTVKVPIL
jgi:hypothetical protein